MLVSIGRIISSALHIRWNGRFYSWCGLVPGWKWGGFRGWEDFLFWICQTTIIYLLHKTVMNRANSFLKESASFIPLSRSPLRDPSLLEADADEQLCHQEGRILEKLHPAVILFHKNSFFCHLFLPCISAAWILLIRVLWCSHKIILKWFFQPQTFLWLLTKSQRIPFSLLKRQFSVLNWPQQIVLPFSIQQNTQSPAPSQTEAETCRLSGGSSRNLSKSFHLHSCLSVFCRIDPVNVDFPHL